MELLAELLEPLANLLEDSARLERELFVLGARVISASEHLATGDHHRGFLLQRVGDSHRVFFFFVTPLKGLARILVRYRTLFTITNYHTRLHV